MATMTNTMVSKSALDDPNLWATLAYTGGTPRLPDARPMADPYMWNGQWVVGGGEDGSAPTPVSADWDPNTRQMRSTGWTQYGTQVGESGDNPDPNAPIYSDDVSQLIGQQWGGKGVPGVWDPRTQTLTISRQREGQGKNDWERATYKMADGQLVQQPGGWTPYQTQGSWKWFKDSGGLAALGAVVGGGLLHGALTGATGASAGIGGAEGAAAADAAGGLLPEFGTTAAYEAGLGAVASPVAGGAVTMTDLAGGGAAVNDVAGLTALDSAAAAAGGAAPAGSSFVTQAMQLIKDNPQLAKLGVMGLAGALAGGAASGGSGVDTTGLMGLFAKSSAIADKQMAMADEVYADAKARYGQYAPMFEEIMRTSMDSSKKAGVMADKLYSQYTDVFMPANKKMVDTAMGYDTPERRAAAQAAAGADVESAHALALADAQRELSRAGISSNNSAATLTDLALAKARDRGAASTKAVRDVENTGIGLVADAAKTGLNVAQLGNQTAQVGAGLNDSATRALTNQQALALAGPQAAAQLQGNAVSALNSAGNLYANSAQIANQNQALKNQGYAGLGSLAGTLLTAGKDSVVGKGLDWLLS